MLSVVVDRILLQVGIFFFVLPSFDGQMSHQMADGGIHAHKTTEVLLTPIKNCQKVKLFVRLKLDTQLICFSHLIFFLKLISVNLAQVHFEL